MSSFKDSKGKLSANKHKEESKETTKKEKDTSTHVICTFILAVLSVPKKRSVDSNDKTEEFLNDPPQIVQQESGNTWIKAAVTNSFSVGPMKLTDTIIATMKICDPDSSDHEWVYVGIFPNKEDTKKKGKHHYEI